MLVILVKPHFVQMLVFLSSVMKRKTERVGAKTLSTLCILSLVSGDFRAYKNDKYSISQAIIL